MRDTYMGKICIVSKLKNQQKNSVSRSRINAYFIQFVCDDLISDTFSLISLYFANIKFIHHNEFGNELKEKYNNKKQ